MIDIDWEKRKMAEAASDDIVTPFKEVVAAATRRVREGRVDNSSRQIVYLVHERGRRVYKVVDGNVKRVGILGLGGVKSAGTLDSDLHIEGIQLDERGNHVKNLVAIQIPRDVMEVTVANLYLQRGSNPASVRTLAEELATAKRVNPKQWISVARIG